MLTLYYSPGACSLAAHIVLEEAGAAFEAKRVTIVKGEHQTPDYLALNPHARVPTLTDGDYVLTESPAILSYLGHRFADPGCSTSTIWSIWGARRSCSTSSRRAFTSPLRRSGGRRGSRTGDRRRRRSSPAAVRPSRAISPSWRRWRRTAPGSSPIAIRSPIRTCSSSTAGAGGSVSTWAAIPAGRATRKRCWRGRPCSAP